MSSPNDGQKQRFLVVHDYGMGGLWWWVWARSAEEILDACAEVEIKTDPDVVQRMSQDLDLQEVDLDDPEPNPLAHLRAQRDAQRGRPGFGVLVGRERVYVRWPIEDPADPAVFLFELGPDGRMLRRVELAPGEDPARSTAAEMPINPPHDLWDPDLAAKEMSREEFEAAWDSADPDRRGQ